MRTGQRYWLQQGNGHGGQAVWSGQREEGGESGKGGGILTLQGQSLVYERSYVEDRKRWVDGNTQKLGLLWGCNY